MQPNDPTLIVFLQAVRRRIIAMRAVERAAIGIAGGALAALALLPILIARHLPTLPFMLTALAVGAIVGLVAAFTRRIDLHDAAQETDRQLNLADLLTSALAVRRRDDPWSRSLLALAGARCNALSPRDVVLARLGVRSWTGIASGVLTALLLAMLYADPASSRGSDQDSLFVALDRAARQPAASESLAFAPSITPAEASDAPSAGPRHPPLNRGHAKASAPAPGATPDQGALVNPAGAGGGEAQSTPSRVQRAQTSSPAPDTRTPTGPLIGGGGRGGDDDASPTGAHAPSGIDSSGGRSPAVPAWQTPNWSSARQSAVQAVRDGSIAAPYRDLVRSYFDQHDPE